MISVDDATALLKANAPERRVIRVPLSDGLGAILAAPITANLTVPPFDASAMDGYGVKFPDVTMAGAMLDIIGEAPAGAPYQGSIATGQAVRLFTGSVIPDGCDHVIIQEHVTRTGDILRVDIPAKTARNIRKAGIDFTKGETLIAAGKRLTPADLALAAAANHAYLDILSPLKIAILANGDELVPPGSILTPGQIIASNSYGLSALAKKWGAKVISLGIASDTLPSITQLITQAESVDIIIAIGGASVGDYDHMKTAFANAGFEIVFSKIAVKPGKPTWFAKNANRCVLGLPGNPASAYVCAELFLKSLLGLSHRTVTAKLSTALPENGPRETYLRSHLTTNNGALYVTPFPKQDSSLIRPYADANCLIKRAPNAKTSDINSLTELILMDGGLTAL